MLNPGKPLRACDLCRIFISAFSSKPPIEPRINNGKSARLETKSWMLARLSLLDGDQLGELGRDVCHRIFCSTQAASRAEQRTDFAESFVRRAMHDGDEQVTR